MVPVKSSFANPGCNALLTLSVLIFGFASARLNAEMLATSAGNDKILRYDETTGAFLGVLVSPEQIADSPTGISVGPDGLIYVSGQNDNTVKRYHATTGAYIDTFVSADSVDIAEPRRMDFGADGSLYVASALNDKVLQFDTQGNLLKTLESSRPILDRPVDVEVLPNGELLVAGNQSLNIVRFATDGTPSLFKSLGSNPGGATIGPDGFYYVLVGTNLGWEIQKFDTVTANRLTRFGETPTNDGVGGLTFGPEGYLYAAFNDNRINRYDVSQEKWLDTIVGPGGVHSHDGYW
jgi:WD40 repeat protein